MLKHMDIYYNTWTNSHIYYITKPAITLINWTLTSKPGCKKQKMHKTITKTLSSINGDFSDVCPPPGLRTILVS